MTSLQRHCPSANDSLVLPSCISSTELLAAFEVGKDTEGGGNAGGRRRLLEFWSTYPLTFVSGASVDVDGRGDEDVQICLGVLSRQLVHDDIREPVVEGVGKRGRIPLTLHCEGPELIGIINNLLAPLDQVKQSTSSLLARASMVENLPAAESLRVGWVHFWPDCTITLTDSEQVRIHNHKRNDHLRNGDRMSRGGGMI